MELTLSYLAAAISVICWIMVLIRMFQASVLKGVLGLICGIYAFVWGWMNSGAGLKNVMWFWTIAILLAMVGGVMGGFSPFPRP
jgi:hypothetical protein